MFNLALTVLAHILPVLLHLRSHLLDAFALRLVRTLQFLHNLLDGGARIDVHSDKGRELVGQLAEDQGARRDTRTRDLERGETRSSIDDAVRGARREGSGDSITHNPLRT